MFTKRVIECKRWQDTISDRVNFESDKLHSLFSFLESFKIGKDSTGGSVSILKLQAS